MPNLSKENLREKLRRREIAPVYLLYGAETYLRDVAAKTIANLAFSEGDYRDFNEDEFSLNTPDNLKTALAAANQLPMMAARRVVRITEVRVAGSSIKDTLKEDYEDSLSAYLLDPSPSSVVIFVADELNGNRKLTKLLRSKAFTVEFTPLDDNDLRKWANEKITEAGSEIDPGVLRYLVELVGPDVRRLNNEATKLSTAALPGKKITKELIDWLVSNSRETSHFDLTDHLLEGNKQRALETLRKVLDDGAEPLAILGLVASNYRRRLMSLNISSNSIYAENLALALQRIAKTDLAIKTSVGGGGPVGARMQIEMLVCELASL